MKKIFAAVLLVSTIPFQNIFSQDRIFGYTYQSNVLPNSATELEYSATVRSGHKNFYNAIDQRFELELGLGKNVQTAFYFNLKTESTLDTSIGEIKTEMRSGFSNEWKFKLSDPVANRFGSGLYAEIGFNGTELELEGKIIFDKKFGGNILALNLVGEYEIAFIPTAGTTDVEGEVETPVELDLAYMHFTGKHSGIGFEVRNHNSIADDNGWESSAWFAGPAIHFNGNRWFINFIVLPQLFNARKTEHTPDNLVLDDHEKVETRLLVSFAF